MMGRRIVVEKAKAREQTGNTTGNTESPNVIVRNLSFKLDVQGLEDSFADCGTIKNVKIIMDHEGRSRGFGFIEFETIEEAQKAIAKDGISLEGREVNV